MAVRLHRAAAEALEAHWAGELDEHLAELAWHRLALAPYGEAARPGGGRCARRKSRCAASPSRRRPAVPGGARGARHRGPTTPRRAEPSSRSAGRGYLAGDLGARWSAAVAAAEEARARGVPSCSPRPRWSLEPVPDPTSRRAHPAVRGGARPPRHRRTRALRARLLARRSQLAFYGGDHELTRTRASRRSTWPARPATTARWSRRCAPGTTPVPGPAGRPERLALAARDARGRRPHRRRVHRDVGPAVADRRTRRGRAARRRRRRAGAPGRGRRARRRPGERVAPRPGARRASPRPGAASPRRARRRPARTSGCG